MNAPDPNPVFERYPTLAVCRDDLMRALQICSEAFSHGKRMLVCGNGGSAADAEHIVGELMKGFLKSRPVPEAFRSALKAEDEAGGAEIADRLQGALPALSLCGHPALSTAFANDVAPEMLFAQQVYGYGGRGDVLLAISTSGNSRNVVNAVIVARALGMRTVGLTGRAGGRLAELCDATVRVPADHTPDIQELHLPVYHWLCRALEEVFFPT